MRLKSRRSNPIIPPPTSRASTTHLLIRAACGRAWGRVLKKGFETWRLPTRCRCWRRATQAQRRAEAAEDASVREIIEAIEEARAHGDLSENAEYHAAKERQGQIEAMIADLEDKLSRAMVIDPTTLSGDKVVFGATVNLLDEDDKKVKYQIVGQTEADAKSAGSATTRRSAGR